MEETEVSDEGAIERIAKLMEPEINEYIVVEEQLKRMKEESKNLATRRKELVQSISKCMIENSISRFKASNGLYLEFKERKEPETLKKDTVKQYIQGKFEMNETEAEKLVEEMFRNRPVNKKMNLQVVDDKKTKRGGRKKKNGAGPSGVGNDAGVGSSVLSGAATHRYAETK